MFNLTQIINDSARNKVAPSYMDAVFVAQDSVNSYNTMLSNRDIYGLSKVKLLSHTC